jgi:hypothetical protein
MRSFFNFFKRIISFIFKSIVPEHKGKESNIVYNNVENVTNIYINSDPPTKNDRRLDR